MLWKCVDVGFWEDGDLASHSYPGEYSHSEKVRNWFWHPEEVPHSEISSSWKKVQMAGQELWGAKCKWEFLKLMGMDYGGGIWGRPADLGEGKILSAVCMMQLWGGLTVPTLWHLWRCGFHVRLRSAYPYLDLWPEMPSQGDHGNHWHPTEEKSLPWLSAHKKEPDRCRGVKNQHALAWRGRETMQPHDRNIAAQIDGKRLMWKTTVNLC